MAVTGVTGILGGLIAGELAAAGESQRLLARTVANAPGLPGAVAVPFAFTAAATALAGVRTLMMVSAAESADRMDQHRAFIDTAATAGVAHIVYTSFIGAAPDAVFTLARDHYATEQHIKSSGMTYTFLRDSFYLDFMPNLVGDDGVIRGPAEDGKVAAVSRADIARTAAVILTNPHAHANRTYELTGPEALTMTQVAAILADVNGVPVTYYSETVTEAYQSRAKWDAPDWQNDAWVTTYTAIASGQLAHTSNDVATITGREPLSLTQLLNGSH